MNLNEMIDLCRTMGKTKKEYEEIRNEIHKEYDSLTEEEKIILADALEELEMAIEWMD